MHNNKQQTARSLSTEFLTNTCFVDLYRRNVKNHLKTKLMHINTVHPSCKKSDVLIVTFLEHRSNSRQKLFQTPPITHMGNSREQNLIRESLPP